MEGIQGAVLGVKLKHLNDWTNGRRKVAQKYKDGLKDIKQIVLPKEMSYAKHVYHLFVIQVNSGNVDQSSKLRDQLKDYLTEKGISVGLHYPIPLHEQKCFEGLGYKKGDFPITEKLAETGLSLPMFPELSDEQIMYVIENIKIFFKGI